jgi:nucleotide-binding universal stress UspA family protein
MKELKTILFGADFTDNSDAAFDYALTLANLSGARLHVLHVIGELADWRRSMIQPEAFEVMEKEVEIHAVKEMKAFCGKHLAGVPHSSEVVLGVPFQLIIQRAEEIRADLIVIGTHGHTPLENILLGSTAERVVRRSKVPVLTVRAPG